VVSALSRAAALANEVAAAAAEYAVIAVMPPTVARETSFRRNPRDRERAEMVSSRELDRRKPGTDKSNPIHQASREHARSAFGGLDLPIVSGDLCI
jgi:hypothetical protein